MDEHQDLVYEESQVLWAKIRGYPWWPAYVSDVHEGDLPSAYQYTVIFFGDNTNSRLGPAKLRKFPEHYSQCYLKAKTNKKLKDSIQKAQQRLSENQQDISMYENIRNELNQKRKKGTVSQSRLSSSEKGEGLQLPDLTKHKTQQPSRSRKPKQIKRDIQIFEQQSESSKSYSNNSQPRKGINNTSSQGRGKRNSKRFRLIKKTPPKQIQIALIQQQSPENRRKRPMRSKQIIQSPLVEKEPYQIRSNQKVKQKTTKQPLQSKQSKQQSQQQQSEKEEELPKPTPPKRRGRKGRPPKNQQVKAEKHKILKQLQVQIQSSEQQVEIQEGKRNRKKLIRAISQPLTTAKNAEHQNKNPSDIGTLTDKEAQKIKKNLTNRKQLTKILLDMPINTGNIKQILDLGPSLALQDGPITKNIHLLLSTLKATLLHKYFPDNSKHRKKYEKMTKQKRKAVERSDDDDNEDNQQNNSDDENKNAMSQQRLQQKVTRMQKPTKRSSSNKQNKVLNNSNIQPMIDQVQQQKLKQIRMKANVKLQKMIRKAGINENARQYASKIENTFQSTAEARGDLYRNIAYQRMRNLKTKLSQFSQNSIHPNEVKTYLENIIQTYQTEASILVRGD